MIMTDDGNNNNTAELIVARTGHKCDDGGRLYIASRCVAGKTKF